MTDPTSTTTPPERRKALLPPHVVRHDFLPPQTVADLLACAEAQQDKFKPAGVGPSKTFRVNPDFRISSKLSDFGPLKKDLDILVRPMGPQIAAQLQVTPFETAKMELELVAHGDGAFYKPHIDLQTGAAGEARTTMRVLSGVYYFHASPKGFAGGALRLLELGAPFDTARFLDIEPVHNSLVFFPSWMPHEVRPVRCASGRFMDSRFAINCWFHRAV